MLVLQQERQQFRSEKAKVFLNNPLVLCERSSMVQLSLNSIFNATSDKSKQSNQNITLTTELTALPTAADLELEDL